MADTPPRANSGEDGSLDHAVPAELIELHETMEWEAAVAKIGSEPNGPTP